MPANYDKLTRSESDSDDQDEERGAPPAQALHGTVMPRAPLLEQVITVSEQPPERPVRLGTIFERSVEVPVEEQSKSKSETDEDDDDDESEATDKRPARRQPAEATPQQSTERIVWPPAEASAADTEPTEPIEQNEDGAEAEQATQPLPSAEQAVSDQQQSENLPDIGKVSERPVPTGEQPLPTTAPYEAPVWPEDDQDAPRQSATAASPAPATATAHSVPPPYHGTSAAKSPNTPPPPPGAPGTGGQPPQPPLNRPPVSPNFGYPNPNASPAVSGSGYNNYNTYSPPATVVRPPYENNPSTRDGFARALAFGAAAGAFIGGRRRKKLAKQVEQNQRQNNANFADLQTQQLRATEQQRRQAQELERMRLGQEQARAAASRIEQAPTYASQENISIPSQRGPEQARPLPPLPPIERPRTATAPTAEQVEQLPDMEQPVAPPEARTIRSSWHEAVVDVHGNVIEGAKQYGRGFEQSRREIVRDRAGDAAAAGTAALAGIQQQQAYDPIVQYPGTLPSGMANQTLPQGMPTHIDPQHQLPPHTKQSTRPGALFWVMLAVILAAFFAAALI